MLMGAGRSKCGIRGGSSGVEERVHTWAVVAKLALRVKLWLRSVRAGS